MRRLFLDTHNSHLPSVWASDEDRIMRPTSFKSRPMYSVDQVWLCSEQKSPTWCLHEVFSDHSLISIRSVATTRSMTRTKTKPSYAYYSQN